MEIKHDYDLTKFNTFGVPVQAKFFVAISNELELKELLINSIFKDNKKLFLGGGSNILLASNFNGIVVLNQLKGIEVLEENENEVWVRAMGGEIWHDLVTFAVRRGYWGVENLSFIPGTVGAAPMQNIGAYGVEIKNTLVNVEAYDIQSGEKKVFNRDECNLGYRDSVFKNSARGKYFISAITLNLSKKANPNVTYRVLKEYLEQNSISDLSLQNISDAVIAIRKSKLPDPKVIGNAGSFFKNVFIDEEELRELQQNYPDIPYFREDNHIKIPAGWLVETCGWKGKQVGNVGVHSKQALVIVNHGGATGEEIKNLAMQIIDSVYKKFGLTLVPEVNFI